MEEIDLKELFYIFWNKKVWIILLTILFAIFGFVYTKYMLVPDYESSATLILTKSNQAQNNTITGNDVTLNQQLVANYTELMKTNNIIRQVIRKPWIYQSNRRGVKRKCNSKFRNIDSIN